MIADDSKIAAIVVIKTINQQWEYGKSSPHHQDSFLTGFAKSNIVLGGYASSENMNY